MLTKTNESPCAMAAHLPTWMVSFALLTLFLGSQAHALEYRDRDLLVGFRQQGGGVYEVMLNLGSIDNYKGLPPGSVTNLSPVIAQALQAAFPDLNLLYFGAYGCVQGSEDAAHPAKTLYISAPRKSRTVQSTPWKRKSEIQFGASCNKISGMGSTASVVSAGFSPDPVKNNDLLVIEPAGTASSYSAFIGLGSDLSGTFQGRVEVQTPADFATSAGAAFCDLYELQPGSGNGTHLGYLALGVDGSLAFTAPGGSPPVPSLSVEDSSVERSASGLVPMNFTVKLASVPVIAASVEYSAAEGSAKPGTDYIAQSGALTFPAGETNLIRTISIQVVGSDLIQEDRNFTLQLSNPTNLTLSKTSATGVIKARTAPVAPRLSRVARGDFSSALKFLGQVGVIYHLHGTNSAGLSTPSIQWPVLGEPVVGTGAEAEIVTQGTENSFFYVLEAR